MGSYEIGGFISDHVRAFCFRCIFQSRSSPVLNSGGAEKSSHPACEHFSEIDRSEYRSGIVFGSLWLLVFLGSILVQAPWAAFHGFVLFAVGILILIFPPIRKLPALWWGLASLFVVGTSTAFLPVDWFEAREWRQDLDALGVDTGPFVAIQWKFALETLVIFVFILFTGVWMAGHRASRGGLRLWSLLFVCGVATYAILSWLVLRSADSNTGTYGFFPNRNHTATYLAMGSICGLGCVLQAIRDKRFARLATFSCRGRDLPVGRWGVVDQSCGNFPDCRRICAVAADVG